MVKVNWKLFLSVLFLFAALLISSNAIRLRQTGSTHLVYPTVDLRSDGLGGPFADLYDQEIRDNATISDAPEVDFGYKGCLFLRELIHKNYDTLWYPLGLVFVIVIILAIDHLTNYRKKEQMYLLFIMSTSLAYAVVAFWGLYIHVFVKESTISKNLDIIISAIIQLYTGMVVIVYWWFLFSCLHITKSALVSGSPSTHHHYLSFDLRFLMPEPIVFTPRKIKLVKHMLFWYIFVRIIGMICCLIVVRYVPYEWHFWLEFVIELLLFFYDFLIHYWVHLFYEAIHHDLPSPLFNKIALYVLVLGLVSSLQEWLLKLMCIFFYLFGKGGVFMITDVPFVHNILLMLEVVPLAFSIYGRFTAATYLTFESAMSCPACRLSSKRN